MKCWQACRITSAFAPVFFKCAPLAPSPVGDVRLQPIVQLHSTVSVKLHPTSHGRFHRCKRFRRCQHDLALETMPVDIVNFEAACILLGFANERIGVAAQYQIATLGGEGHKWLLRVHNKLPFACCAWRLWRWLRLLQKRASCVNPEL